MQKKNREGFTLIELLAVIVILAIIALIAVPVIMNVITKARVSAFEDSAYGIVKAGELYYSNQLLETEGMTEDQEFTVDGNVFKNAEGKTLDISGSLPSSGKVTVTSEGKVALAISNGEYCIRKATTESKVKAEKLSDLEGACDYKKVANSIFTIATDGTEIPACIKDNTLCDVASAGDDGLKVGVKVNASETYDFYVMSEDANKNEITLLMSENLGDTVVWVTKDDYLEAGGTEAEWGEYGNNNKGPITALNYLESQTLGWTNIPLETYELTDNNVTPQYSSMTRTARARLVTINDSNDGSWAYENLNYLSPYGYWTSTAHSFDSFRAFYITYNGGIDADLGVDYDGCGVRPVITISKTIL